MLAAHEVAEAVERYRAVFDHLVSTRASADAPEQT
jgi:hypothetical protein